MTIESCHPTEAIRCAPKVTCLASAYFDAAQVPRAVAQTELRPKQLLPVSWWPKGIVLRLPDTIQDASYWGSYILFTKRGNPRLGWTIEIKVIETMWMKMYTRICRTDCVD